MNEIGDDMIQLPTTIGREERLKAAECRRMAGETKLYRKGRRSEWKCRWLFWEGGLEAIISSRQTAAQKLLVCKTIWYYMYWDANEMSCYHHQLASDCPESCRTNCQIEIWSPKHHWKSKKRPCPWFIAASSVKVAAKRHKNLIQVAVRGLTRCSPSSLAKQPLGGKRKSNLPHTSRKSSKSRVKISWGLDIWGIQKVATATRSSNLWRVSTWWTAGSLSLTISSPESDWSFRAKITLRLLQNSSVTTSVLRDACYDKERFLWVHHFTLQPTVVKTAVTCQSMIEGPSGRAQVHWDGTWKWLSMFDTWRIHNKDVFLNDSW
jgi:hypothetical protein